MQTSIVETSPVSAIILAAGLSQRMGAFKLTLPWDGTTVVGKVATTLRSVTLHEILAVIGYRREEVEAALSDQSVRCVFNPNYATGDMLSSIQAGFAAVGASIGAVVVCLGDQPQMEAATLRAVLSEGKRTRWQRVVIPSYAMRAGHPILIPTSLRPQIMNTTESLRAVLRANANLLDYLVVDTPSILADLDTPEDYAQARGAGPAAPDRS